MFALLIADVDLQQDIQCPPRLCGLAAETLCDFEPVDRVDHRERPQRQFRLTTLDCADGVPADGVQPGFGGGIGFLPQFFQSIFAEVDLAGGRGLRDQGQRLCLAHRHERNFIRRTLGPAGSLGHARAYLAQIFSNRHGRWSQ